MFQELFLWNEKVDMFIKSSILGSTTGGDWLQQILPHICNSFVGGAIHKPLMKAPKKKHMGKLYLHQQYIEHSCTICSEG